MSNSAELTFDGKSVEFRFEKKNGLFGVASWNTKTGKPDVFVGKTWRF